LACFILAAQTGGPKVGITPRATRARATRSAANIRVDVKLTLIPVTVTGIDGAAFPGLTRDDFRLFEDGVEQEIRYFSSDESAVSLGVVFDASQSMSGKMDQSRAAVSRFFDMRIDGDEFFHIEFNDVPRVLCDFTTDTGEIEKTLVGIQPKNWTALFDAVYMSIRKMKGARRQRKALLILSDGGDNSSRYTESEMKSLVREADVSIYSIALVGGGLMRRHVGLLRSISEQTGGQVYEVEKISDLPEAVRKASAAIRHQYVLGYVSTNTANDGLYRRTEVRLNARPDLPKLRATWKNGYYAAE
jgi:VWFA-related protein